MHAVNVTNEDLIWRCLVRILLFFFTRKPFDLFLVYMLIDCWLLIVQWQKFHVYLGREQVQQLSMSNKGWDGTQQDNGF